MVLILLDFLLKKYTINIKTKGTGNMNRFLFLLLAIWMMTATAVSAYSQESVNFVSKDGGLKRAISVEQLLKVMDNSDTLVEGELVDQLMEDYEVAYPSSGPNELAVEVLKSRISNEILFLQWTSSGKLHSFRILSKEFGWLEATRKARRVLTKAIPDCD